MSGTVPGKDHEQWDIVHTVEQQDKSSYAWFRDVAGICPNFCDSPSFFNHVPQFGSKQGSFAGPKSLWRESSLDWKNEVFCTYEARIKNLNQVTYDSRFTASFQSLFNRWSCSSWKHSSHRGQGECAVNVSSVLNLLLLSEACSSLWTDCHTSALLQWEHTSPSVHAAEPRGSEALQVRGKSIWNENVLP